MCLERSQSLRYSKIRFNYIFLNMNTSYNIFSWFKDAIYLCSETPASLGPQNLPDKPDMCPSCQKYNKNTLLVVLVAGGFFFVTFHPHQHCTLCVDPSQPSLNTSDVPSSATSSAPSAGSHLATIALVKLGCRLLRGCISTKLQIQLSFLSVWCRLILD